MKQPGKIKSALLNWLGVPITLRDGAFWSEFMGTSSATGKTVSVDVALQISTFWACVRLLSETVATLPLGVYRKKADGSRDTASNHQLYALLCQSPNAEMTPGRFMLFIVASIAVRGNAFIEKRYVGSTLAALIPLLPQNVVVKRNESGFLYYEVTEDGGKSRVIKADKMMHIRGFGLDGVCGMQPVQIGKEVIGASIAANEAAASVFSKGLQASGVITVENGYLKPEQREQIRASMSQFSQSTNAGKLMVLEAGMKYQGIAMNPESAQMLQTRNFNVEEICRWFMVPPFMVGHMDKASSWASSVEAQNLHFLTSALMPILRNIEEEITRCLVPRNEWGTIYAEFNIEGLLRADSAGRAAYYNIMAQNGIMCRDEIRRKENMAPIPGGDIFTVQTNLTPLHMLGKTRADPGKAAQMALKAWLAQLETATPTEA